MSVQQLETALKSERGNYTDENAIVRFDGDKAISWGLAAQIMDIAKRNKYKFVVGLKK